MKYHLYTTSQKAWDGMFSAMLKAQQSIYLEMYIFSNDTQLTHDFLKLLQDKARAGLEIVIIVDSFGSFSFSHSHANDLRKLGVEFIYFNRIFQRTHRKILIIDKKIAFVGGVNIMEETRYWYDLQIKLEGQIIKPILKSFARTYELAGGENKNILYYSHLALVKKIKSWVIDNLAGGSPAYLISSYYKEKISSAQKSITIVTPYLLPPHWFLALLEGACRRGVRIKFLLPNSTDIKLINRINYLNACRLAAIGVKFYLMSSMNHAKIMLIDDEEGVIGSQNMDILSFNWNIEGGVFLDKKN